MFFILPASHFDYKLHNLLLYLWYLHNKVLYNDLVLGSPFVSLEFLITRACFLKSMYLPFSFLFFMSIVFVFRACVFRFRPWFRCWCLNWVGSPTVFYLTQCSSLYQSWERTGSVCAPHVCILMLLCCNCSSVRHAGLLRSAHCFELLTDNETCRGPGTFRA